MAKVYLKGVKEPLEISEESAKEVSRIFENANIPKETVIALNDFSSRKSEIKLIVPSKKENRKDYFSDSNKEYDEGRAVRLRLSPEEKAKQSYHYFGLIYYGFTGNNEVPDKVWQKALVLMVDFYRDNPRRIWAEPAIFKDLLPKKDIESSVYRILEATVLLDQKKAREEEKEKTEVESLLELAEQSNVTGNI